MTGVTSYTQFDVPYAIFFYLFLNPIKSSNEIKKNLQFLSFTNHAKIRLSMGFFTLNMIKVFAEIN